MGNRSFGSALKKYKQKTNSYNVPTISKLFPTSLALFKSNGQCHFSKHDIFYGSSSSLKAVSCIIALFSFSKLIAPLALFYISQTEKISDITSLNCWHSEGMLLEGLHGLIGPYKVPLLERSRQSGQKWHASEFFHSQSSWLENGNTCNFFFNIVISII